MQIGQFFVEFGRCLVFPELTQGRGKTLRDGGQVLVAERVESCSETGEADGIHCELLQIGGRVRRSMPDVGIPTVDQLGADVEHGAVVVAQAGIADAGHQDVVGLLLIRLTVVGGEQTVAGEVAYPLQWLHQVLGEPVLVAQLFDQIPWNMRTAFDRR